MEFSEVPVVLFFVIVALFICWFNLFKKHNLIKSVFFLYYGFNFLIFLGPILYYRLGYDGYSNMISYNSLFIFYIIVIVVTLFNIIISYLVLNYNKTIFYNSLSKITFNNLINRRLVTHFYIVTYVVSLVYILMYRGFFPISKLISEGELGERLDTSGTIPFYIGMSSAFMVFIPSGFLYFRNLVSSKILKTILFIFTLFCLSAGGNKGLVSFFLIFYLTLVNKKQSVLRYLLLIILLAFIYSIFKGVKTFDQETLSYLIESPFRRVFAAQGSGFIARIEMMLNNDFVEGWEIKKQVYSKIYDVPLGEGASPTHFLGNLIVDYGYFIGFFIYVIYLSFFIRLLYTASKIYFNDTKSSFVGWNFFLLAFLTLNSDLSVANTLRFFLIFINIYLVYYVSNYKTKI